MSEKSSKQNWIRHALIGAASISLDPYVKIETPITIKNPLDGRSKGFKGDLEALRSDSLKLQQDLNKAIEELLGE